MTPGVLPVFVWKSSLYRTNGPIGQLCENGRVIDLRSDTVTQPTTAMRRAIAEAVVGDEQEREDPTVLELERRGAALLGQEEAVYIPTATMGNQIALAILGER